MWKGMTALAVGAWLLATSPGGTLAITGFGIQ